MTMLRESPLKRIGYVPDMPIVERHPHYEILLELCGEDIPFFTLTVDEERAWAVTVGDNYYLVGNDAPQSAIKVMEPFLDFDTVTGLKEATFGR